MVMTMLWRQHSCGTNETVWSPSQRSTISTSGRVNSPRMSTAIRPWPAIVRSTAPPPYTRALTGCMAAWRSGSVVRRTNKVTLCRALQLLYRDGWWLSSGWYKPTRSTQSCIPPGLLNRRPLAPLHWSPMVECSTAHAAIGLLIGRHAVSLHHVSVQWQQAAYWPRARFVIYNCLVGFCFYSFYVTFSVMVSCCRLSWLFSTRYVCFVSWDDEH